MTNYWQLEAVIDEVTVTPGLTKVHATDGQNEITLVVATELATGFKVGQPLVSAYREEAAE